MTSPEAAPRLDVVGSPFSTFKRGEGEATLRKRFDAWQYGQQWHEALDDAIATRIEAEAVAGTAEQGLPALDVEALREVAEAARCYEYGGRWSMMEAKQHRDAALLRLGLIRETDTLNPDQTWPEYESTDPFMDLIEQGVSPQEALARLAGEDSKTDDRDTLLSQPDGKVAP